MQKRRRSERQTSAGAAAVLVALALCPGTKAESAADCLSAARQAYKHRQYDQALTTLDSCAPSPEFHRLKGMAYYHQYRHEKACAHLEKAYEMGITDDQLLLGLAQTHLWKRDFKRPGPLLNQVNDKSSAGYKQVRASYHELLGEYDAAIGLYDQILLMQKQPPEIMVRKAEVLSWAKRFDESLALFTRALNSPRMEDTLKVYALIRRGQVRTWVKKFDEAAADFDAALALDRGNVDVRFQQAQLFEWQGKYDEAKAVYQEILALQPGNREAQLNLQNIQWKR